jgi:hypothetical protein
MNTGRIFSPFFFSIIKINCESVEPSEEIRNITYQQGPQPLPS